MCIVMVIIYKKTLEKKGADDVTAKSTDLGRVRCYFLLLQDVFLALMLFLEQIMACRSVFCSCFMASRDIFLFFQLKL